MSSNPSHVLFRLSARLEMGEALDEAFDYFQRFQCQLVAVVFPEGSTPGPELTEMMLKRLRRSPEIQSVALVHGGRGLGLVASSIALSAKGVRVRAYRSLPELRDDEQTGGPTPSTRPSGPAPFQSGVLGQLVVARFDDGSAEGLRRALQRFREENGAACVLLIDHDKPVPRDLNEVFAEELATLPALRGLGIVHPSPMAGFLASAIGLMAPHILVRAFRDLNEATVLPELIANMRQVS